MPVQLNGVYWQISEIIDATGGSMYKVNRFFSKLDTTVKVGQTFLVPEEDALAYINKTGINAVKTMALTTAAKAVRMYARNFMRILSVGIPTNKGRIQKDHFTILFKHIQAARKNGRIPKRDLEKIGRAAFAEIEALEK